MYTFMAGSIGLTFRGGNANTLGAYFALDTQSSLEDKKKEVGVEMGLSDCRLSQRQSKNGLELGA